MPSRPNIGEIMMHDVNIEAMTKLETLILALSLFSWSSKQYTSDRSSTQINQKD